MVEVNRRQTLALGAGAFLTSLLTAGAVQAAGKDTLTIAFNVNLPSFDPTDGTSAVNPTIQAIYRSIFDQYIGQSPDLTLKPGILTAWGWNDDKTKLWMDVRPDVKWQDGSPLTPEDVVDAIYWVVTRPAHVNINSLQMMPVVQAFAGPVVKRKGQ